MFSRALRRVARGEPLEVSPSGLRMVSHTTHTIRCVAGATSNNPDADIDIFGYLFVDGALVDFKTARGYTPSVGLNATVPSADYDRRVVCEVYAGSASAFGSGTLLAVDSPFVGVGSDSQNWWWNDRWRRDIWYQVYHQDGRTWSRGGEVWEEWDRWYNPCQLDLQTEIAAQVNSNGQFLDTYYSVPRDPACVLHATQRFRLTTASLLTIHEIHYWRFDNTGVWRQ